MDYKKVRNDQLETIKNRYGEVLNEYIMLYNEYLQNSTNVTEDDVSKKNQELIDIIQKLKENNVYLNNEVDKIYDEKQDNLYIQASRISNQMRNITDKNRELDSSKQLIYQIEVNYRRQRIILFFLVILLISLLAGVIFLFFKVGQQLVLNNDVNLSGFFKPKQSAS
jgi:ribosomal protein L16 Arg81 hydroxylase